MNIYFLWLRKIFLSFNFRSNSVEVSVDFIEKLVRSEICYLVVFWIGSLKFRVGLWIGKKWVFCFML